jgi:hypothetical protein
LKWEESSSGKYTIKSGDTYLTKVPCPCNKNLNWRCILEAKFTPEAYIFSLVNSLAVLDVGMDVKICCFCCVIVSRLGVCGLGVMSSSPLWKEYVSVHVRTCWIIWRAHDSEVLDGKSTASLGQCFQRSHRGLWHDFYFLKSQSKRKENYNKGGLFRVFVLVFVFKIVVRYNLIMHKIQS